MEVWKKKIRRFLAMAAVVAGAAMMSAASPSCCRTSDDVNGAVTGQ